MNLETIKKNWQTLCRLAKEKDTASLLDSAHPTKYEGNCLTLTFSSEFDTSVCARKSEQVTKLLSTILQIDITLNFQTDPDLSQPATANGSTSKQPGKNIRQEALDDPAVKTLLAGMNATITNIHEVKQSD